MKLCIDTLAERIDNYFFPEDHAAEVHNHQILSVYFDEHYTMPRNFLRHLSKEIRIGLILSSILCLLISTFLPARLLTFWESNYCLTIWLVVIWLLNGLATGPRSLVYMRISRICRMQDNYSSGYSLWTLFRSKLFKINGNFGKFIFMWYVSGLGLIIWERSTADSELFWACAFFMFVYFARLILHYIQFCRNFDALDVSGLLVDFMNGTSAENIKSLESIKYSAFMKVNTNSHLDTSCSICFEEFNEDVIIKQMRCPGGHIFHQKCIDPWLLRNEKCPLCNCSAFSENKKEKID